MRKLTIKYCYIQPLHVQPSLGQYFEKKAEHLGRILQNLSVDTNIKTETPTA